MLLHLGTDALQHILSFCTARTLACLECVCTELRQQVRHVPAQIHLTPHTAQDVLEWARGRTVTKACVRRVLLPQPTLPLFECLTPDLRILDIQFTRVPDYVMVDVVRAFPQLQRLRLSRITRSSQFSQSTFHLSLLPPSLVDVNLTFDDTWTTVIIDDVKNIRKLRCQCFHGMWLGQPNFLVTHLGHVDTLWLLTYGFIMSLVEGHTASEVVIDCDNRTSCVLDTFERVKDLTVHLPNAKLSASQVQRLEPEEAQVFVGSWNSDCDIAFPLHVVTQ